MDKKEEVSGLFDYGIDISVENCKVEDLLHGCFSTKEGSIPSMAIIRIARVVEAACWFEGKWCIKIDGTLVRCVESMKIENFFKVKIKPLNSESNVSSLLCFGEMQNSGKYEEKDFSVSMSFFYNKS